jgi:recombination protein RecA
MGDAHVGLQARLMSQALRKLTGTLAKSKTILVFINQIRMKIGVMFGNPETTTGGNALKFYASVRLEVRKIETIEKGEEEAVGNRVRVKVVKNKVAPPFRKVELEIMFGKGISASGSLIDAAVKYDVVDKKGAWYAFGEDKIGQGRDNAKLFVEQNPDVAAEIERRVREKIFSAAGGGTDKAPEAKPGAKAAAAPAQAAAPQAAPKAEAATASLAAKTASLVEPAAAKPAARGPGRPPKSAVPAEDEGLF